MKDQINPDHYKKGKAELIDSMGNLLSPEEFNGFCKGNVFKYVFREKHKGGIIDLKKAAWYLDKLIGKYEADNK